MSGARYFVTFIDDFSNKVWMYVLKSKVECFERFMEFKAFVEMQLENNIKAFWLDNNRNFIFKIFERFLKD